MTLNTHEYNTTHKPKISKTISLTKNNPFSMLKTNIYLLIALVLATISTSCGSSQEKENTPTAPAITVSTAVVSGTTTQTQINASGKIAAKNSAVISTRIMGHIDDVHVKIGDKVTKGQVLLSINNADLQAKKAQVAAGISVANAGYTVALKDYNRFKNLFKSNSVSQKEMDDITAHFNMAKAQLEAAEQMKNEVAAQFQYAKITAPFTGVITHSFYNKGDMATPGMPLLNMEGEGDFEVNTTVSAHEVVNIKKGEAVNITIDAIGKTVQGTVNEVSSSAQNNGGQYPVTIVVNKTKATLLSGMFATVQFSVKNNNTNKVLIPKEALVYKGQLTGIYTPSEHNTAILRWLRIGQTHNNHIAVLSGLTTGETYIIDADKKLYNGAHITVK